MTKDEFITIAENAGLHTCTYSGRGMYGKECMAIAAGSLQEGLAQLIEGIPTASLDTDAATIVRGFRWDSLGDGVVIYWPDIPA